MSGFNAFKEHIEFNPQKPWNVDYIFFDRDISVSPLHYAETVEVLFCHAAKGYVRIDSTQFDISGNKVFFIAPGTIHSTSYQNSNGQVTNIKLDLACLKSYIDIEAIVADYGLSLQQLSTTVPYNEKTVKISHILRHPDSDFFEVLTAILAFFNILIQNSIQNGCAKCNLVADDSLKKIISWTEHNFYRKISLDEVASLLGYNKYYFCNKFKKSTGISYFNYLNTLRIHNACYLLKKGYTINEVCEICGFDSISYFIQLFKKIVGLTPKKYITSTTNTIDR